MTSIRLRNKICGRYLYYSNIRPYSVGGKKLLKLLRTIMIILSLEALIANNIKLKRYGE